MATTFEVFAGKRAANYSTLPTIDVEILPDVHHCKEKECGAEVAYRAGSYGQCGHVDGSTAHRASPRVRCTFCHNDDPATVKYRQHAYHDAVECARCGGHDGYAIGD